MNIDRIENLIAIYDDLATKAGFADAFIQCNTNPFREHFKEKYAKYLKFYHSGKGHRRIERLITKEMIDYISLEYLTKKYPTEILKNIDKDIIWDYMEDDIEDYVDNNCKERVKKWED